MPPEKFEIIPNAVLPDANFRSKTVEEFLCGLGIDPIPPVGDYHPVSKPQYDPDEETYVSTLPQAPSRQTPHIIGVVARLWPQKRIQDLLWVFETLQFVNLNFHALIIGDGPLRDTLLRFRDDWRLESRVHFLGLRNDVAQLMPSFDVLLSASESEGQSNSILEAMSCSVPVISSIPQASGFWRQPGTPR